MAGKTGNDRIVAHNLQVFRFDEQLSLLYLSGSVPGRKGGLVEVKDATLKKFQQWRTLNYPTFVKEEKEYASIEEYTGMMDRSEFNDDDNNERLGISDEEEVKGDFDSEEEL